MRAKWRAFVDEYFRLNMNGTRAYKAVYGVEDDNVAGASAARLLGKVKVKAEIERRLKEKAMAADEVITRLADMARGDLGDFMDIESMSFDISLQKAKELGLTHLIKKVKQRTVTTVDSSGEETETNVQEIELHSSLEALNTIARAHGLFKDQIEHSGDIRILVEYEDADPEAA